MNFLLYWLASAGRITGISLIFLFCYGFVLWLIPLGMAAEGGFAYWKAVLGAHIVAALVLWIIWSFHYPM